MRETSYDSAWSKRYISRYWERLVSSFFLFNITTWLSDKTSYEAIHWIIIHADLNFFSATESIECEWRTDDDDECEWQESTQKQWQRVRSLLNRLQHTGTCPTTLQTITGTRIKLFTHITYVWRSWLISKKCEIKKKVFRDRRRHRRSEKWSTKSICSE